MPTLEAQAMPPRVRHETIFERLDQLVTGETLRLVNAHDHAPARLRVSDLDFDSVTPATLAQLEVLFDELMRTVPRQYGVTFASIDTTLVNMATIVMPLVGAAVSGIAGIETALRFSAFLSLCGLVLFVQAARRRGSATTTDSQAANVTAAA